MVVRDGVGGRHIEGTCRSVLDKGSWVTQGKYGLALRWQIPREALTVPHLSPAPPPPVPLSPNAWSREAMMNFP